MSSHGTRLSVLITMDGITKVWSIDYVKNRAAELHPENPRLTDTQAVEEIIRDYAAITERIRT